MRMELASHGKGADEMKAAMQEAHNALARELNDHMDSSDKKHADMKKVLEEVNKDHHDKHAQNAKELESGISGALGAAHKKMKEEKAAFRSEQGEGQGNLRQVLLEDAVGAVVCHPDVD